MKPFDISKIFSGRSFSDCDLLIVSGEHSGDQHAADLIKDLLKSQPSLRIASLGGPALKNCVSHFLGDLTPLSVVGFAEVLRHYWTFKSLLEKLLSWIQDNQPRHILLVDYPGFNLRLAEALYHKKLSKKGGGCISINYYIAPQVWAWKSKRRFTMSKFLDSLAVILPFEVTSFSDTSLPTTFVGHPFVKKFNQSFPSRLIWHPDSPIGILPGSREAPIQRIFPALLRGIRWWRYDKIDNQKREFIIIYPNEAILKILKRILEKFPDLAPSFQYVSDCQKKVSLSAVLTSSGTLSLECALSGIPGTIVYKTHPITYWIGKKLVKISHLGLANILLEKVLYPELIQEETFPENISQNLDRSLKIAQSPESWKEQIADLRRVLLGSPSKTASQWLEDAINYKKL